MNLTSNNIESVIKRTSMPKCAGNKCAHYNEGCGLGYRTQRSNHSSVDADEFRMMFSEEFKGYWEKQLAGESTPGYFSCFHKECDCENDCNYLADTRFMTSHFKKYHPEKVHDNCKQKITDYLGDLPATLHELLQSITTDWSKNREIRGQLDALAMEYIPKRIETAVMLLDLYDVLEVSCLNSMVPSQKAEWCWRHYNPYFRLFTQIILAAHKNFEAGTEEFTGQFEYLITKFHYEWERRRSVLERGSLVEFKKAIKPIRDFIEIVPLKKVKP